MSRSVRSPTLDLRRIGVVPGIQWGRVDEPSIPLLNADASQIRQIVMPLITDAAEALIGESGPVRVTTGSIIVEEPSPGASPPPEDLPPGRYVFLDDSDTECGMDEEIRARMFEPHFTTRFERRGQGTAGVPQVVRGHRGSPRAGSEPDLGTTIRILFPVAEDAVEDPCDKVGTSVPERTVR